MVRRTPENTENMVRRTPENTEKPAENRENETLRQARDLIQESVLRQTETVETLRRSMEIEMLRQGEALRRSMEEEMRRQAETIKLMTETAQRAVEVAERARLEMRERTESILLESRELQEVTRQQVEGVQKVFTEVLERTQRLSPGTSTPTSADPRPPGSRRGKAKGDRGRSDSEGEEEKSSKIEETYSSKRGGSKKKKRGRVTPTPSQTEEEESSSSDEGEGRKTQKRPGQRARKIRKLMALIAQSDSEGEGKADSRLKREIREVLGVPWSPAEAPEHPRSIKKALVLDKYDGVKTDWMDFVQHLEIVAQSNNWTEEEKGLQLAANLTGSARTVLRGLSGAEYKHFDLVFGRLERKFGTATRAETYKTELRNYRKRAEDTLVTYGDGVERLVDLAYPQMPEDLRQTMLVDAFIRGLPSGQLRVQTQLHKFKELAAAVDFALHYEQAEQEGGMARKPVVRAVGAVDPPESETTGDQGVAQVERQLSGARPDSAATTKDDVGQLVTLLKRVLEVMNSQGRTGNNKRTRGDGCFRCGKTGHFRRDCPEKPKENQATEKRNSQEQSEN